MEKTSSFTVVSNIMKYLFINLNKETKGIYTKTTKHCWKELKKHTTCVYELEDLILFTCANYPSQSVQSLSNVQLQPHGLQHARLLCPSPTPGVYSNSCPSTWWCHPTISSPVIPFSCLQSFLASGSFPMSRFFASGGQSIGVSASASVLPMHIQDWFPLVLAGWISLQSRGLSRVLLNTTVQKDEFFGAQLSL